MVLYRKSVLTLVTKHQEWFMFWSTMDNLWLSLLTKNLSWILPYFLKNFSTVFLPSDQPTIVHSWPFFVTFFAYFPSVPFASQMNRPKSHRKVCSLPKETFYRGICLAWVLLCSRNMDFDCDLSSRAMIQMYIQWPSFSKCKINKHIYCCIHIMGGKS